MVWSFERLIRRWYLMSWHSLTHLLYVLCLAQGHLNMQAWGQTINYASKEQLKKGTSFYEIHNQRTKHELIIFIMKKLLFHSFTSLWLLFLTNHVPSVSGFDIFFHVGNHQMYWKWCHITAQKIYVARYARKIFCSFCYNFNHFMNCMLFTVFRTVSRVSTYLPNKDDCDCKFYLANGLSDKS